MAPNDDALTIKLQKTDIQMKDVDRNLRNTVLEKPIALNCSYVSNNVSPDTYYLKNEYDYALKLDVWHFQ